MARAEVSVVVVDDSSRFPLHLWRFLSQSLGLGIGNVDDEGRVAGEEKPWITPIGGPAPWPPREERADLLSEDQRLRVLWVQAKTGWKENLRIAREAAAGSALLLVIDVYGQSGYSAADVIASLSGPQAELARPAAVFVVSAYYSGIQEGLDAEGAEELRVRSKSRDTLRQIKKQVDTLLADRRRGSRPAWAGGANAAKTHHLLVTGAGFERHGGQGGFGLPEAKQLLRTMARTIRTIQWDYTCKSGFPVPQLDRAHQDGIRRAAESEDLDRYWDLLLEYQLARRTRPRVRVGEADTDRELRKIRALRFERQIRDAFRASLLQHDWGYLQQALRAARLDWRFWLTTNYTRFADRAILATQRSRWRIVSTAAEARMLVRDTTSPAAVDDRERLLFKLHGDIAHLQTMAIAGNDKDTFSPLSVPIDDLYQLYEVALSRIVALAHEDKDVVVVWHIVGHALRDARLLSLVARSAQRMNRAQHAFLVVDQDPAPVAKRLRDALGAAAQHPVCPVQLYAAQYMARLPPDLPQLAAAGELTDWVGAYFDPAPAT